MELFIVNKKRSPYSLVDIFDQCCENVQKLLVKNYLSNIYILLNIYIYIQ